MNAKRIIAATVISATVIGTAVNAFALDVYLDGNKVEFPTQPYISNNRTLVPLRPIFEKMGWNIQWDESTKQATFSGKLTQDEWNSEDVSINIDVDSPTSNVIQYTYTDSLQTYGYWYVTDVKPEIKDDTIMMPLRAISELIRKNVTWDENTQSVYIADGIPDNTYVKIPKDKVESIREACNATDDYELVAMYPLKQGDEEATAWKGRGVSVYFRNGNELRFLDYWENINEFMSIGSSEDNGLIDDYNYRCFGKVSNSVIDYNQLSLDLGAPEGSGYNYHITPETAIALMKIRYDLDVSLTSENDTSFVLENDRCIFVVDKYYETDNLLDVRYTFDLK